MKYILTLIILCLLLTIVWFHQGKIFGGGDAGLAFYSPNISLNLSKITWIEVGTGVSTIGLLPTVPLLYFYSIWEKIGIPTVFLQASYFFIVMAVGVLSMYFLCTHFLKGKNQLTSFVAAIFYLFNPFTMSQIWARGLLAQQTSFAILPLSMLLFIWGVGRRDYLYAVLIVLTSLIFSTAYSFLTFIIVFWLMLLILLLFNRSFFSLVFFLITLILWMSTHAWWFLPLLTSSVSIYSVGISGSQENLGTLLGVSRNFTPDILIRLLQRTYFFDPSALSTVYSSLLFQLISWLPVVFLVYGLYKILRLRLKQFYLFIMLLVLGLFVSLGANLPFGWLFVILFKSFSVIQAFRNPFEKFGLVLVLAYSMIFAYGLISFFTSKKYKFLAISMVLFLICGIFAWPMWTGRVIAGPDKKIGLSVPSYYKDLQGWLNEKNEDHKQSLNSSLNSEYRLFMTPLWNGDGAFYQWGGSRYQGSDPMYWLLKVPTVSNIHSAPFFTDYMQGIRKYMGRINLAGALALLRSKYIVNREDAILLTDKEKEHSRLLTQSIYPPSESSNEKICQDKYADSSANGSAGMICQILEVQKDLSQVRYLIINIRTDVPAFLDITLRDRKKTTIRWDGRAAEEYQTNDANFTKIILPLSAPTEYNSSIDFRDLKQIEISARQKSSKDISVKEIFLKEIAIDGGEEIKINAFNHVKTFGNLKVYEPLKFNSPPEFGSLSSLEQVKDVAGLFEEANRNFDHVDKKGFILLSQNPQKNLQNLPNSFSLKEIEKKKISNTRYWLKVLDGNFGVILLSKTFSPEWKLIPHVTLKELSQNLFTDIALLKKIIVGEDSHFVVNGYGNLWIVNGNTSEYAIVYRPQIIADIGMNVSKLALGPIIGIFVLLLAKKYVKGYKKGIWFG